MEKERRVYPLLPYFFVNSVTLARAALGLGATAAYALGDPATTLKLMAASATLDAIDGPLARSLQVTSPEGQMRDLLADTILFTSIIGMLVTRLDQTGTGVSIIFVAAFATMGTFYALSQGL